MPDEVGAEAVGVFRAYGFDAALAGFTAPGRRRPRRTRRSPISSRTMAASISPAATRP
ncbi:cyanophycinase CphB domain protein [Mycobacterium ulcerans str. Harvey]|uniref:Cyanophycinase CphB domain protein n=1 Tax=Mycobacterium ulcerans str. Harvey TaxID=1299332 RepID=A0ABN0R192_MYCUL|nr:cyanophycinase CphB domain protein [Mycobacterium ulcerans str. Harvey]